METVEVVVVAPPCHNISKGKRTKRYRPHSPIPFSVINHRLSPASDDSTTTEEEDTAARCLILLAQGHFPIQPPPKTVNTTKIVATAERGGAASACMYACKTCDRVFSSFQALGGHRTSHKNPKNNEKKPPLTFYDVVDEDYPSKKRITPPSLSLQLSTAATAGGGKQFPSPRIHECSHCGAEFTSGQALGGHMRRHRAGPISPNPEAAYVAEPVAKKPRNELSLDLNFPALDDENQRLGFESGPQKGPEKVVRLPTTTPTLVDCHF